MAPNRRWCVTLVAVSDELLSVAVRYESPARVGDCRLEARYSAYAEHFSANAIA